MKNFVIRVGINAVALWVAALVVTGVHLGRADAEWTRQVGVIVLVALIFGVVNAALKPIAVFLAFPAIVLTLGLFTFVVNAFLLQVTEWLAGIFRLPFTIDAFWWDAVFAAVVITLVSWALSIVLPEEEHR